MEHLVFTIGREFGSGGKEISLKLAEKLGLSCYDNELLTIAASESGLSEEVLKKSDEKPARTFFQNIAPGPYHMTSYSISGFSEMPLNHKIFLAQFEEIKKLADRESCVIVGRCADYALADHSRRISIFVHADMDFRLARVRADVDLDDAKLLDYIQKADRKRANYYNYYSGKKWADSRSYDLCLDSSVLGIDRCVEVICSYAGIRFPEWMQEGNGRLML